MKKLLIFLFILCFQTAKSQVYQLMPQYGYDTKRMNFDSTLSIPTFCGVPSLRSNMIKKSAIAYDSCNKRFYYYDPKLMAWDTIKGGGASSIDTTSLSNRINQRIDSLKRTGDSVFARKNGLWVFQYKDSVDGGVGTLQSVTDNGNTTSNSIEVYGGNSIRVWSDSVNGLLSSYLAEDGTIYSKGSYILGSNFSNNNLTSNIISIDSFTQYRNIYIPDTSGTIPLYINGKGADRTGNITLSLIDSLKRSTDSIYARKNGSWVFQYKDSIGGASGFVPYTGATQDVDLGANGLSAKFIKVTGTAGNGHIDLKHQSNTPTGQANSTLIFANSSGYLKWKNDNLYFSTLATPQTADRTFTTQDKSYTLGDSADIAARVKYTDTATMLNPYQRKFSTDTMRTNIYSTLNGKLNISDTATMLSGYAKTSAVNLKVNYTDTASMLTNYQRITPFPIATFGAGSGAAGDTAIFTTSAIYGSFYNTGGDSIVITGYIAVCQGTSPSITPTIYFNDSLNVAAGATKIVNSPSAVTSTTTGNNVTSLNNTTIPPGNFVWVNTGTITTKPTYFSLTLYGYRKRP